MISRIRSWDGRSAGRENDGPRAYRSRRKVSIPRAVGEELMPQTLVIGHVALIQRSKKQWFTLGLIKALRDKGYDAVGVFAGECREPEYRNRDLAYSSDRPRDSKTGCGREEIC